MPPWPGGILYNRTAQLAAAVPWPNSTGAQARGSGDTTASQPTGPDVPRGRSVRKYKRLDWCKWLIEPIIYFHCPSHKARPPARSCLMWKLGAHSNASHPLRTTSPSRSPLLGCQSSCLRCQKGDIFQFFSCPTAGYIGQAALSAAFWANVFFFFLITNT